MSEHPRPTIAPRGLNRLEAAAYIGVSVDTFQRLVNDRLMPPGRAIYTLKVWDVLELDRAFGELPHAAGSPAIKSGAVSPVEDFT
jgi:hypothetical protein